MCLIQSGRPGDRALGQPRPVARGDPPEHGPTDRLRVPPPAGPVDAQVRLRTPPCPLPPDPNAVDAAPQGGFARLAGDTSYQSASDPESGTSVTVLPGGGGGRRTPRVHAREGRRTQQRPAPGECTAHRCDPPPTRAPPLRARSYRAPRTHANEAGNHGVRTADLRIRLRGEREDCRPPFWAQAWPRR